MARGRARGLLLSRLCDALDGAVARQTPATRRRRVFGHRAGLSVLRQRAAWHPPGPSHRPTRWLAATWPARVCWARAPAFWHWQRWPPSAAPGRTPRFPTSRSTSWVVSPGGHRDAGLLRGHVRMARTFCGRWPTASPRAARHHHTSRPAPCGAGGTCHEIVVNGCCWQRWGWRCWRSRSGTSRGF